MTDDTPTYEFQAIAAQYDNEADEWEVLFERAEDGSTREYCSRTLPGETDSRVHEREFGNEVRLETTPDQPDE
jgi:hypothetical protein